MSRSGKFRLHDDLEMDRHLDRMKPFHQKQILVWERRQLFQTSLSRPVTGVD
jgi:hypothetical protein